MPGVLTGLIPACHTPFDRDGGLNLAAVHSSGVAFSGNGPARRLHRRHYRRVFVVDRK